MTVSGKRYPLLRKGLASKNQTRGSKHPVSPSAMPDYGRTKREGSNHNSTPQSFDKVCNKNSFSSIFMKDSIMNSSDTHDPISAPWAYFKSEYLSTSDDVKLKVLQWQPKTKDPKKAVGSVIFVSGWVSHVSGWAELLSSMTQNRRVFYIETREKISAHIKKKDICVNDFTIANIAQIR